MRMRDIYPEHVREWITWMQNRGAKPATIQKCKRAILNAIFTTALQDHVINVRPGHGVKIPPVPKKSLKIITAKQFGALYAALPDADAQLLVETDIESGLRWGELTELRVKDLDFDTRILTVSRAVVELAPEFHPTGGRFLVKQYPKDGEYRRFKLSKQIVAKLKAHVEAQGLEMDGLFFQFRVEDTGPAVRKIRTTPPEGLGKTEPNDKGHQYDHGTLTAYTTGRCRCDYCKEAYRTYRAARRGAGKDSPRKPRRKRDSDGHIPNDWFRNNIWNRACTQADIAGATPHGMRHAHASWLLAGGADLQVVKERLGHATIATTEKYLHTLPNADETALEALRKIRDQKPDDPPPDHADELQASEHEIARLRGIIADMTIAQHSSDRHLQPA
jgi:integrase